MHSVLSSTILLLLSSCINIDAFIIPQKQKTFSTKNVAFSTRTGNDVDASFSPSSSTETKPLGLITFDLDDTLYPLKDVIDEANESFAKAMDRFGYEGVEPETIREAAKTIRKELPTSEASLLSFTELRKLAIRRVMEDITFHRKLEAMAEDFSTDVENLSKIVVEPARKWATQAVSPSIVDAALTAWEMGRHHASERNLYPEVIDVLREIKEEHPDVIIGAVTDGKANPLLMTFTLMNYFDFCMSWEDDQGARTNFFKELDSVEGNAELSWIYQAALDKGNVLASTNANMKEVDTKEIGKDSLWIHVGDDLAYDVGGAAQCGAKTVYVELDEDKYKQTARLRFDDTSEESQPSWSTSSKKELDTRVEMNEAAVTLVDKKIRFLTRLPEAVNEIVKEANKD